jgi:hypothetical protein
VLTTAATATATTSPFAGLSPLLALTMIIVTAGYLLLCWIWPFRACRHCRGVGRFMGPMRGIRLCRRCDGTGLKLRAGRRLWNAGTKTYRQLTPRKSRRP